MQKASLGSLFLGFGLVLPGLAGAQPGDCVACHAESGFVEQADVPTIGGFSAYYLEATLQAYRDGDRACPTIRFPDAARGETTMCEIAKALSDKDISDWAKHYAEQRFVPTAQSAEAAVLAQGKALHERHCEKCHSENGAVADDDAGILAGQKRAYLEHSMQELISGDRPSLKKMTQVLQGLSAQEVEALVDFYASEQ